MNARKSIVALSIALLVLLSFNMTASAGPAYPMPGPGTYYVVHTGDTLFSIATRFHTTVWAVSRANGILNPSLIFRGQVLVIPTSGPTPGPFPPAPRPGPVALMHIVRPGENLSGIAAMYGVNAWAIAQANGLANPSYIFAGERLIIPARTPFVGSVYGQPWGNAGQPTQWGSNPGYPTQWGNNPGYPTQWGSNPGYPAQWGNNPGYPSVNPYYGNGTMSGTPAGY